MRCAAYRRGRCPVREGTSDTGQRHYHALVPPSRATVDLRSVASLQVGFGKYVGSGSISDGFQARLRVVYATSDREERRGANELLGASADEGLPPQSTVAASSCGDMVRGSVGTFQTAQYSDGTGGVLKAHSTPGATPDSQTRTFDVVIKLVRPGYRPRKGLTRSDMMGQILGEADLYATNMLSLQGTVVPRFYGVWTLERRVCSSKLEPDQETPPSDSLTECVLTILEDVGTPIGKDDPATRAQMDEADRERIREVHRALHAVGVVHGEASHKMSHTMVDSSGRVRLIDFERSQRCERFVEGQPVPLAVAYELEKLESHLRGEN